MSESFVASEENEIDDILANPLSKVDTIDVGKDANEFAKKLEIFSEETISVFQDEDKSWEEKGNMIMENLRYIKSGALSFQEYDFRKIVHYCCSDEILVCGKPRNIKLCCQLVSSIVREKKNDFLSLIDLTIHNFFACSANHSSSSFITSLCKQTIIGIVDYVESPKTLECILKESKSKMKENRLTVIQCINTVATSWNKNIVDQVIKSMKQQLRTYATDQAEEVRTLAREVLLLVNETNVITTGTFSRLPKQSSKDYVSPPSSAKPLSQAVQKIPQRSKSPAKRSKAYMISSASNASNMPQARSRFIPHPVPNKPFLSPNDNRRRSLVLQRQPINDTKNISEFMPPQTKEEANLFIQKLKVIVSTGDYLILESLEFGIPSSIIAAKEYYPSYEFYSMIVELTESGETMKEEMKNQAGELFLAFIPFTTPKMSKQVARALALTKDAELIFQYFVSKFGAEQVSLSLIAADESEDNKKEVLTYLFFVLLIKKKMISSIKNETIINYIKKLLETSNQAQMIPQEAASLLETAIAKKKKVSKLPVPTSLDGRTRSPIKTRSSLRSPKTKEKEKEEKPAKMDLFGFKSLESFISSKDFDEYDISSNQIIIDIDSFISFITENMSTIADIVSSQEEEKISNMLSFILDASEIFPNTCVFNHEGDAKDEEIRLIEGLLALSVREDVIGAKARKVASFVLKDPSILIDFFSEREEDVPFVLYEIINDENCFVQFFEKQKQKTKSCEQESSLFCIILERICDFFSSEELKERRTAFSIVAKITEYADRDESENCDKKLDAVIREKIMSLPQFFQRVLRKSEEFV